MHRSSLRASVLASLLILPLAACKKSDAEEVGSDSGTDTTEGGVMLGAAATSVAIAKVSINQGVQVTLHINGSDVSPLNTDLVAGRRALVRVFVAPLSGWVPREIQAALTVEGASGTEIYETTMMVGGVSSDGDLGSTFNFVLPGEAVPGDVDLSISLHEVDEAMFDGDSSQSRWPMDGSTYAADFKAVGPLRITLVPVQYDADGSGRLPDTSEAQVQVYRDLFEGMYPVPSVEITVTPPFPWGSAVAATGNGWQQLLAAITGLRGTLGLSPDEYIYGVFNAADTFMDFCGFGCVAGLSSLAMNPGDSMARASIGIGFTGEEAASTMAHEVGHAHGREHAPCMLGGQPSDPGYPYAGAALGVWGWDGPSNQLKDPDGYTDIMGYCQPTWISDYTYDGLLARSIAVNALAMGGELPVQEWSTTWVDGDGRLGTITTQSMQVGELGGERHRVQFLDASDAVVSEAEAHFYPTDHLPGGILAWPAAPARSRTVDIEGFGRLAID